ncbi:MAG: hypothetical protein ACTSO2_17920 [Promethearchaeota archaeon]
MAIFPLDAAGCGAGGWKVGAAGCGAEGWKVGAAGCGAEGWKVGAAGCGAEGWKVGAAGCGAEGWKVGAAGLPIVPAFNPFTILYVFSTEELRLEIVDDNCEMLFFRFPRVVTAFWIKLLSSLIVFATLDRLDFSKASCKSWTTVFNFPISLIIKRLPLTTCDICSLKCSKTVFDITSLNFLF